MRSLFSSIENWFLSRPRPIKRLITGCVDYVAVMFALLGAFSLRLSTFYIPPQEQLWLFFAAPVLAIPIFIRLGLYRAVIRYIGMDALWAILKAIFFYTLLLMMVVVLTRDLAGLVPRTVYGINAVVLLILVGGCRFIARWLFTKQSSRKAGRHKKHSFIPPVIIYGAGNAGVKLAALLKMGRQLRPVGFVDDDRALHEQQINGITVHAFADIQKLIDRYQVNEILLAMPSIPRCQRNQILQSLEPYALHVRTLPDMTDIAQGKLSVSDIQEVDIADLLGRQPVEPDITLLNRNIKDKNVLVTGAGGSIGSELCRQIIMLEPAQIVLYEISEFSLYQIEKELESLNSTTPIVSLLGSVLDEARLTSVCQRFDIHTIYHAAAYKHVPMVERNITEGVRNNVLGTLHAAKAAINSGVETFVLISTDKAVRPTNTMGASKRMAELVLQGLASASEAAKDTRFTMVRFGNVLGSSGSVVPLFRQQIINGGPVTVTHPDIIRYFMTIPEAAELVIQAGAMGLGGDVFVLDMGEPVKIVNLAKRMIHLSGLTVNDEQNPDGDIAIEFTGLRHGEKLYEELLIGSNVSVTKHQKIMCAKEHIIQWPILQVMLTELSDAIEQGNHQRVREILLEHVDGFAPQCDIEDWLKL
ncbi:polysaccharide biosynthesis protein [Methylophaga sp. OBS3]|uniref:polysaccharide biosynthesis protein n=1 Tax=Methylophaga sp. OBS3 TaxID=2991934 RepID=UPI0022565382|nr:nucleoside-diphosphate sugar epimerase/dehydratase [Methylophaga sp. OBS3]MCX4190265.1 polysaccharide biosynthesis protein [Methylophaga sp. OBS3]